MHHIWKSCTCPYINCIKFIHNIVNRNCLSNYAVCLDIYSKRPDIIYLLLNKILRKTKFGNPIHHYATRFMKSLKKVDSMPHFCKFCSACKPGWTRANDRNFKRGFMSDLHFILISIFLRKEIVCGKSFKPSYRYGIFWVCIVDYARRLTKIFLWAHPSTNRRKRVVFSNIFARFFELSPCNQTYECWNVNVNGAGNNAPWF